MQDAGSAGPPTTPGEGKARVLLLLPCPTSARTDTHGQVSWRTPLKRERPWRGT